MRQELRAAGSEAAAAEAVANVAVEAMAEARFRHGPAARVAVLVLRVGEYDVIAAVEGVAAVPRPVAPPASSDTRELVLWRPTPSAQPPRWTIPVAPVELPPPPPPAAVTPPSSRALTPVRAKRRFVDVDGDDARASKRPMRSSCVNRFFASAPGKRSRSRSPSPSPRKRRGAMMSP